MKYYTIYDPKNNVNKILEYDEKKNGAARYAANGYFLFHGAVHVPQIFTSAEQALKECGEYNKKLCIMPDGTKIIPKEFFHSEQILNDIFIPWDMVRDEVWP